MILSTNFFPYKSLNVHLKAFSGKGKFNICFEDDDVDLIHLKNTIHRNVFQNK